MEKLNEILQNVRKPARYIGEETNIIKKEFSDSRVSMVISYPDIYEIGMSYLGLKLLYHLLNERDDVLCERVFMPWDDMEKELTSRGSKLFSLETKTALDEFDIIGFSLSYELTYTNVLSILYLGGISLFSKERREDEPFVIAGGACCFNPEPMSDFIDIFFIGDAEETLPEFIDLFKEIKTLDIPRLEKLKRIASIPGVYVPCLYEARYNEGLFAGLEAKSREIPKTIKKASVRDLNNAYFPVKPIVPYIKTIHDRIVVEIMRGCPNRCRFCQANSINRPVRFRDPETIRRICIETYHNTGYAQLALLSLSSVNYPYLVDVVKMLNADFSDKGVGISIPSLRVDESFYDLPEMLSAIHKGGLTFAPETALEDVLNAIGKSIDVSVLCKSAEIAYKHGWNKIKLYFMIGFTENSLDEAEQIIKVARELSRLRKKVSKGPAEIKLSINPFVPKPHTPFQWIGMQSKERLDEIKSFLTENSSKKVQVEVHDIKKSMLECCLSRGGREIGAVIYSAWKKGAKLDSWSEFFEFNTWDEAFKQNKMNIEEIARKKYNIKEILPWAHIHTELSEEYLLKELKESNLS